MILDENNTLESSKPLKKKKKSAVVRVHKRWIPKAQLTVCKD